MSTTDPRSGIHHSWGQGSSGWGEEMDNNLKRIGRFSFHLSVKDRSLTSPPSSPADGDSYLVSAGATGLWAAKDSQIAVWESASSAWIFGQPRLGWMAFIEDEEVLVVYKSTGWSAGLSV